MSKASAEHDLDYVRTLAEEGRSAPRAHSDQIGSRDVLDCLCRYGATRRVGLDPRQRRNEAGANKAAQANCRIALQECFIREL